MGKHLLTSLVPRLHSPGFIAQWVKAGREPGTFRHCAIKAGEWSLGTKLLNDTSQQKFNEQLHVPVDEITSN